MILEQLKLALLANVASNVVVFADVAVWRISVYDPMFASGSHLPEKVAVRRGGGGQSEDKFSADGSCVDGRV